MHVAKLAAMALVEDDDHPFPIDRMILLLLDEGGQLLDGGNDDVGVVVLQLLFQNGGGSVAVGRPFLKAVVLLHSLVVQILPVHHEQHLIDVGQLGGQTGRLEGGQRFAAAGGVPDVAAALDGAVLLVVVGDLNAVQNPLGGGDLIGPHDHQHIFRGEDTVPDQHIQNGMLGEEGAGEVDEVGDHLVVGIRPEGGELKAVAGFLLLCLAAGCLTDGVEPSGVGVVLGVGTIGDDEDLHILKEAAPRPERVPLIAVNLVESLPEGHAPSLELDMYQWKTIDQDGHIIAVVVPGPLLLTHLVLVDDLETVVVDILLVDEGDIFGGAVIPPEHLHEVLLDLPGFLHDMLVGVSNSVGEEPLPLAVGKLVVVQGLQLAAQIGDEVGFLMNLQILIALLGEQLDKLPLQRRFALVAVRAVFHRLVGGDNGVFRCGGDNVEIIHFNTSSASPFPYRSKSSI